MGKKTKQKPTYFRAKCIECIDQHKQIGRVKEYFFGGKLKDVQRLFQDLICEFVTAKISITL